MQSPVSRFLATIGIAGMLVAFGGPTMAQQGHNPFPATPVASGWQVAEVTALEFVGTAIALSPDGTAIAGVGEERDFCIWSVPDFDPTCAGSVELAIDPDSLAWAPDSSAVAFSVRAFEFVIDGDIHVFERADGEIHNITDDGVDRITITKPVEKPALVDVMPAWSPDSASIVFSRTVYDDREELSNEIMRVARAGGEPETLLSLPGLPTAIFSPMRVLGDGSVLYTVGFFERSEPMNGLWLMAPDGEAAQLMPGNGSAAFPVPIIDAVWEGNDELRVGGHSYLRFGLLDIDTPIAFTWSSTTGEAVPLEPSGDVRGTVTLPGSYSPDGETLLTVEKPGAMLAQVILQGPVEHMVELPETDVDPLPGLPRHAAPTWSSTNLVLIPPLLTTSAYLLTMEPTS